MKKSSSGGCRSTLLQHLAVPVNDAEWKHFEENGRKPVFSIKKTEKWFAWDRDES
jgi:hypothetical protein